jgi:hypothetical protein
LLKSSHDPDGSHSWIEINEWAIDAANGAARPIIIMRTDEYYDVMQMSKINSAIESRTNVEGAE